MKLRTKYLIHPRLQITVLAVALALSALSGLLIYSFFASYFKSLQSALMSAGILPGSPLFEYLLIQKSKMESMLLWIGLGVCCLNTVILTLLTHKIAGPIYRINKSIEALLEDRANSTIKVRKGDFFADTAALLERVRRRGLKDPSDKKAG